MQKSAIEVLYSASDIVNYIECEHLTTLDLINLDTPLPKTADDEQVQLIQAKGYAHEADFLRLLKLQHSSLIDLSGVGSSTNLKVDATLQAMRDGYEIIFQATLRDDCLIGHADFLRKVPRPSNLGNWSYEVLDTKLARSTKAKFIIQLGFYSALVAKAQGLPPLQMYVVLGDRTEVAFRYADYARYLNFVTQRFLERVNGKTLDTYPVPCAKCDQCKWIGLCEDKRLKDDHLCLVANINNLQIKKLQLAGVTTLEALGSLTEETQVPKMHSETLEKLHRQARLQLLARQSGERQLELLPLEVGTLRGFARLPRPDAGDLFFDMEGNPLEEGGLEYLFGLYFFRDGKPEFKPFWGHSRAEEKLAFEAFMDYVTAWLHQHPSAHIYHYAHYEQTALKKLMSLHGTREAEVDNLLRTQKMVDLYKVVREGIRVSEPKYSIKNIEHFYLENRTGDVTNAGASIVYYERWKETGDPQLLKDIEDYNFDDVRSTYELQQWLLKLRPAEVLWAKDSVVGEEKTTPEVGELTDVEKRLIPYQEKLIDPLPEDRKVWGKSEHLQELTFQLLDFHRRAAKPQWWAMFSRMEMSEEELLEDGECLAGLVLDPDSPLRNEKRSILYTYLFPEQESKLRTESPATIIQTGESASNLVIDEDTRRVSFTRSAKKDPLPATIALGPGMPMGTGVLVDAVFRFGDSLISADSRYPATESFLSQLPPRLKGREEESPIVPVGNESMEKIIEAIASLDNSYMFVQGPPGAGKTYTGSHVIVSLLKMGYRIGVSSNSHKAINNLLEGIEKVAKEQEYIFRGAKKSTSNKPDSYFNGECIKDVFGNEEIFNFFGSDVEFKLVAGTAWLFAGVGMDQQLDYIFVDEAGQVALANLVAMSTSSRNIVLLGDQMQLGQPIQGVHPGRSGESSLEYLLNGLSTIPPDRGIFLATTWRMHPDVCRFISDAVYDGRLHPEPKNINQVLLLNKEALPILLPAGIRYIPIEHDACSQRSHEEGELILEIVNNLLKQGYQDKNGQSHPMTLNNILVVAPYNMQVNLLKAILPEGTRVGTVDKFQGQEAEVVIVSMTTSSGEYLPRFIEFLYSKNRLNVAISRAKSLAIFIANPALMLIACNTPEEMVLVNTLCWVREVG
jgi:uncharacterized protein